MMYRICERFGKWPYEWENLDRQAAANLIAYHDIRRREEVEDYSNAKGSLF